MRKIRRSSRHCIPDNDYYVIRDYRAAAGFFG